MIHLYVEHLLNIRTLSIQASLSTVSNKRTTATLSADGKTLTLTHGGESARVKLPINVSPNTQSSAKLTIPAVPSKDLSFRIRLEAKAGAEHDLLSNGYREDSNVVPWTATSLTPTTEICCACCNDVLVQRGKIRTWKDLPSEGWAEMMEFWHCHKPHDHHEHDVGETKQGYAAGSKLAVESGVGLVDSLDFLFKPGDCENVTTCNSLEANRNDTTQLICGNCQALLGDIETSTQAYKLRKLHLSLSIYPNGTATLYSSEKWLACLLLCAMDNQGVRKFLVRRNTGNGSKALKLWIFASDLVVSSSAMPVPDPVRFMKVLWLEVEDLATNGERLTAAALSEGELKLANDELNSLEQLLTRGGGLIPKSARRFQEWNVGLLERLSIEETRPS